MLRMVPLPNSGEDLKAHEDEQLDVYAEPLGALLLDEVRDIRARDKVDVDVLIFVAAPFADLPDAVRANECEALRQHSGRRVKVAEPLDSFGREASFLLHLLDSCALDGGIAVLV